MIFLPFLHFFAFTACIFLAIFILSKNTNAHLNRACSVMMICYGFWNLGDVIVQNPDISITKETAIIMQNIAALGWISYSCALLSFSIAFIKKSSILKSNLFKAAIILIPLLFIYLQLTNRLTINPTKTYYGWTFDWANNIWAYLFYAYYSIFTTISIVLVYNYGKKSTNKNEKKHANVIIILFGVGTIIGTLLDIIIQQMSFNILPPLANLMVFLFGSGILYSIYKFRFLTITTTFAAENIVSAMDEILILLNQENAILSINNAGISTLKYSKSEVIGNHLSMLMPDNTSNSAKNNDILKDDIISNKESYLVNKYGEYVPIIYSSTALKDYEGITIGTVFIARDITEYNQIVQELIKAKDHAEESDRLKSAFLANISHEIRTPMNGIIGFTELLKKPNISNEEQLSYIKMIEKSGARMLSIVNDIVQISKIESGLSELNLKVTNINEHLDTLLAFFTPEVESKRLEIVLNKGLETSNAYLETDIEKLLSALTNLIKNAIKFTEKGTITFGYALKNKDDLSYLEFYVQDTGIGIPENKHDAIFDRFIQADISNRVAYQGAGLGLSISKAFVKMLNGEIWLESKEGEGSIFKFTTPYEINIQTKVEIPINNNVIKKNKDKFKILLAEDDEGLIFLMSETLEDFYSELIVARNGEEAVQLCKENSDIDLILMDIRMPKLDGYEATEEIRKFNKSVIIIAQTACAFESDHENALKAGCNDYVSKPIEYSLLTNIISKYLK